MNNVSIKLIKELRDRTSISVTECKNALIDANGNIQLAINNMRKNGIIKAKKKSIRTTKEGIILIKKTTDKKSGIILELNCETDFVRKNNQFENFGDNVATIALKKKITNLDLLRHECEKKRQTLISIFDENINIRRISYITGETIGSYLHNNKKIGVILSITNLSQKKKLLKYIAMHIAANKPEYVNVQNIPKNIIDQEKHIQMNLAIQSGKPYKIAEKIAEGRINKFINEISLINQPFIINEKKTILEILNENNITIDNFIRFEIGEEIN